MSHRPRVLYLTYDGIMEPLGQSQVFQYLRKLAVEHDIALISFEKAHDWSDTQRREEIRAEMGRAGIAWIPLRYHKSPTAIATSFDIGVGFLTALFLALRNRIEIVHARSYVSSVIALGVTRLIRLPFIFDMRGFWPDEKIDMGSWQPGAGIYHVAKWFERRFLTQSDVVVSLTHAGVDAMRKIPYLQEQMPWFEVIPTCTNLEIFAPAPGRLDRPPPGDDFLLGYVGSVGSFYLFDPVLECFKILRRKRSRARLRIINRGAHDYIRERLAHHGIPLDQIELREAQHRQVAVEMAGMDAAIFFIKQTYSKLASAPTRLGEHLGCGIPCLANTRVGDQADILEKERVGVVLDEFTPEAEEAAVDRLLALLEDRTVYRRAVEVAHRYFSLDDGAAAYARIYCKLLGELELASGAK